MSQLREEWLAHAHAREQLLEKAIRTAGEWIDRQEDPKLGKIGRAFRKSVARTACKEKIDIFYNGIAHYTSFNYAGDNPFPNTIIYGPSAEEDIVRLYSSKIHELTHVLQKMHSAALHASPFNRNTQIIICPRDWLTLEERCEQDAYVKQALFNSLLAKSLPEVRSMTDRHALSVKTFEKIRLNSANVHEALIQAARQALDKSIYWDNPDSEFKFRNHYHDFALKNYTAGMEARRKNGEKDFIFVRLEPEDIEAIGASCGPNIFGTDGVLPEFLEKPVLQESTAAKLAELNKCLGISNEDALPTLGEVLIKLGMTRADFIAAAYISYPDSAVGANMTKPAP